MVDKTVSFCGYVECVVPHDGLLKKGEVYTVMNETEDGYVLWEVEPPSPFTSFHKNRFKVLDTKNERLITAIEIDWLFGTEG